MTDAEQNSLLKRLNLDIADGPFQSVIAALCLNLSEKSIKEEELQDVSNDLGTIIVLLSNDTNCPITSFLPRKIRYLKCQIKLTYIFLCFGSGQGYLKLSLKFVDYTSQQNSRI